MKSDATRLVALVADDQISPTYDQFLDELIADPPRAREALCDLACALAGMGLAFGKVSGRQHRWLDEFLSKTFTP